MGQRRWRIKIISGSDLGAVFHLTGERVRIGRTRGDVVLKSDYRASGVHAELFYQRTADTWAIRDLHSSNGTRVNNEPIFVKNLTIGDRIKIGSTEFVIEEDEGTGEMPRAARGGLRLVASGGRAAEGSEQERKPPGKADPFDDLVRALSSPGPFFASLAGASPQPRRAALFLATVAGIAGALSALLIYAGYLDIESLPIASVSRGLASVAMIPLALVTELVFAGIGSLVLWALARLFGGKATMAETFRSAVFTLAPAVASPLLLAVPEYGKYLVLLPMLFSFYLCSLALTRTHGAKPAPSYAACAVFACMVAATQLYVITVGGGGSTAPGGRRIASPPAARAIPRLPRRDR